MEARGWFLRLSFFSLAFAGEGIQEGNKGEESRKDLRFAVIVKSLSGFAAQVACSNIIP